jgi:hypothetical protein
MVGLLMSSNILDNSAFRSRRLANVQPLHIRRTAAYRASCDTETRHNYVSRVCSQQQIVKRIVTVFWGPFVGNAKIQPRRSMNLRPTDIYCHKIYIHITLPLPSTLAL